MTGTQDLLPPDTGWPWSAALVVGPPLAGKGAFLTRLLAAGLEECEGALLFTTDESAADRFDRYSALDAEGVRIVDATGTPSADPRVRTVGSPADLTGLGMAFDAAMQTLRSEGYDRVRVGVDALTTLDAYTDSHRVSRFVNVLADRIATVDAVGLFVVHGDTVDVDVASRVDARVEFRERNGGVEFRVDDVVGVTEWRQYAPDEDSHGLTTTRSNVDPVPVDSLSALADQVNDERLTLTVVNGDPDTVDRLEPLFDRLQVDVRAATLDVDEPAGVALLHRGDDLLASEPVAPLLADAEGVDRSPGRLPEMSPVLEAASRSLYHLDTDHRQELVDRSRLVERLADRTGAGTIHAGFQALSRLVGDAETLGLYRRLATNGVDVHLYGTPDAAVPEAFTVHGAPAAELERTWFVVFDGDDDARRMGALVARDDGSGRYEGFWTYQPSLVVGLAAYLEGVYGSQVVDAPTS